MGNFYPDMPDIKTNYKEMAAKEEAETDDIELKSYLRIQRNCAKFFEPQLQLSPFMRHQEQGFKFTCDIDMDDTDSVERFDLIVSDIEEQDSDNEAIEPTHLFVIHFGELATSIRFCEDLDCIRDLTFFYHYEGGGVDVAEPETELYVALDTALQKALDRDAELPRIV